MQTLSTFETHTWCSDREMEDYIGTESCVDFQQHTDVSVVVDGGRSRGQCSDSGRRLATRREKKEYPPPISSPWVLKRYYTSDGRLIIREENVGRHEYFKVCRANGRLTLQLVPRDEEIVGDDDVEEREDYYDDVGCCSNLDGEGCGEPDPDGDDDVECEDDIVDGCDESDDGVSGDRTVERAVSVAVIGAVRLERVAVGGGLGGGGKCYNNYTSVISRPCLFGMPVVPAIRTVHI
ncbi:hypothetical protein RHGRI_016907 [Rhododendron griersonianum]|uniref:FAF domain-containing protein n=1 Tax=Rhododendron griersonianum TaxID=479676 RepID=A0AAV6JVX4_9ERIC|nr:hypothetical protein RHGRI_016907 [Rhododendron griersonianum]